MEGRREKHRFDRGVKKTKVLLFEPYLEYLEKLALRMQKSWIHTESRKGFV